MAGVSNNLGSTFFLLFFAFFFAHAAQKRGGRAVAGPSACLVSVFFNQRFQITTALPQSVPWLKEVNMQLQFSDTET